MIRPMLASFVAAVIGGITAIGALLLVDEIDRRLNRS